MTIEKIYSSQSSIKPPPVFYLDIFLINWCFIHRILTLIPKPITTRLYTQNQSLTAFKTVPLSPPFSPSHPFLSPPILTPRFDIPARHAPHHHRQTKPHPHPLPLHHLLTLPIHPPAQRPQLQQQQQQANGLRPVRRAAEQRSASAARRRHSHDGANARFHLLPYPIQAPREDPLAG